MCFVDTKRINCNWKRICFKGCPAIAFEKYGTIDSISDNCEYIKQIYSEKLKERIRKGR